MPYTSLKILNCGRYSKAQKYLFPVLYGNQSSSNKHTSAGSKTALEQADIFARASSRAIAKIRAYAFGNMNMYDTKPVLLTLTHRNNETNYKIANQHFKTFIQRFNYFLHFKLRYIAVSETQKRGSIHFHIIIFNLPFISGKIIEKIWTHGATDIELANIKAVPYLTKYISKDFKNNHYKGQRRYLHALDYKPILIRNQAYAMDAFKLLNSKDIINTFKFKIKNSENYVINTEYIKNKEGSPSL